MSTWILWSLYILTLFFVFYKKVKIQKQMQKMLNWNKITYRFIAMYKKLF